MGTRRGPTLAERSAASTPTDTPAADLTAGQDPALAALQDRPRPVLTRHCWVTLPDTGGRRAGLLAEWRRDPHDGTWQGRVVYALDQRGGTVLVEAWVAADHLHPIG